MTPASLSSRFCGWSSLAHRAAVRLRRLRREYTRVEGFSNRDAGAIVLKGTTGQPRLGNAPHRVAETYDGMLNAIGLQNPGVDKVVREILPTLDFSETRFIATSAARPSTNTWKSRGASINHQSTRSRSTSRARTSRKRRAVRQRAGDVRARGGGVPRGDTKPLITKLSPNQTDIRENARRCIEAGTDAFA